MKTLFLRPVFWALGAGTLGFILHLWATKVCIDRYGLWLQSHPLALCLFCLAAIGTIAVVLFTFKEKKGSLCHLVQDSFLGALGSFAAAFGFLFLALSLNWKGSLLSDAAKLLACLSATAMGINGVLQLFGRKPSFACSLPAVLLFMVYPLSRHGAWSMQTQFLEYGFTLLALVALLLFNYAHCHLTVAPFICAGCGCPVSLAASSA